MRRAIIAAGGWAHPGEDIIDAARSLIATHGFDQVEVVRDDASFVNALEQPCDLLVVGACWFSMSDARYTESQRAEHRVVLTPAAAESLQRVRDSGCPLLALHTAVICFDGQAEWSDWLGGSWNWQTSFHPPPELIDVRPAKSLGLSFEPFVVTDELYQGLDLDPAVDIVAESRQGHPLAWLHETSAGRCAVNVLGHDHRSLADADHQRLNNQLLSWLLS